MAKTVIIVLIFCSTQLLTIVNTRPTDEDINKIFSKNFSPLSSISKNSEDCVYNLCKSSNGYNEDQLKKIISNVKYQQYLPLFGTVLDKPSTNITVETRFPGESKGKSNMCYTKRMTMYPKKGFNIDAKEKQIINVPDYHQMVTFEACVDGAECYAGKDYLPLDVTSSCETQFIVVRLVVVNEDNTLSLEQFSIPSGCSCMYSRV